MFKTSDLRVRDVINVNDGRRLGQMTDIEVDLEGGRITAIIVPGQARGFALFSRPDSDYVIPWEKIVRVGVDVILVDIPTSPSETRSRRP